MYSGPDILMDKFKPLIYDAIVQYLNSFNVLQ